MSGKLPGVDGELQDNPHRNRYGSDPEVVDSEVRGVNGTRSCSLADSGRRGDGDDDLPTMVTVSKTGE